MSDEQQHIPAEEWTQVKEQVNSLVAWRNTIMGGVAVIVVLLGVGVYDGNKVSNSIDEILADLTKSREAQTQAKHEFQLYQAGVKPLQGEEIKEWTLQQLHERDAKIEANHAAITELDK